MRKKSKIFKYALIAAVFTIGAIGFYSIDIDKEMLTGSFTEAGESEPRVVHESERASVEKVIWKIGEKTFEGRAVKHNFSEGTHNVTAIIVKSNGENETHHGQVHIK